MLNYFLVFAGSLLVDIIPFLGPPAWSVIVFFHLKYHLNIWIVLLVGVLGSTIGRYLFTLYIPHFTSKVVKTEKDKDLEFLGKKLSGKPWQIQLAVFVYTLIPVPTTPLFTALGMAKVNPLKIMPVFFIGKFLSDMYMVFAGKLAAENVKDIMHGLVSWQSILGAAVCILFISFMLFTDWKELFTNKKLKFNFKIWK